MPPSTILIADDDRSIRMVLSQALIRLGYQVRSHGQCRDPLALGDRRGGRSGRHRRRHAGRERVRRDAAHQKIRAASCASS